MTIPEAYGALGKLLDPQGDDASLLADVRRRYVEAENARRAQAAEIVEQHLDRLFGRGGDDVQEARREYVHGLFEAGPQPALALCSVEMLDMYARRSINNGVKTRVKRRHSNRELALPADVEMKGVKDDPTRSGIDAAKPRLLAIVVPFVGERLAETARRRFDRSLLELMALKHTDVSFEGLVPCHARPDQDVNDAGTLKRLEDLLYQWHARDLGQLLAGMKFYCEARSIEEFQRMCLVQAAGELFQRKFGEAEIAKYTRPLTDAERAQWQQRAAKMKGGAGAAQ